MSVAAPVKNIYHKTPTAIVKTMANAVSFLIRNFVDVLG